LYSRLIGSFGSELALLLDTPVEDIARSQGFLVSEAIRRMREGKTNPRPGFDGEFGVIRVFDDDELARLRGQDDLFPAPARAGRKHRDFEDVTVPVQARRAEPAESAGQLDGEQEAIVSSLAPRILVSAGPGAGKTRVLAHWIAAQRERSPGGILALTFTNKAAAELSARLTGANVQASTFHSFCWSVLRENTPRLLSVISPSDRMTILLGMLPHEGALGLRKLTERMELAWEGMKDADDELVEVMLRYEHILDEIGAADISSLVPRTLALLLSNGGVLETIQKRYRAIAVDELQDIDRPQYDLLRLLADGAEAVLCIGDPDQSIYGFRGADRKLFFEFARVTGAETLALRRNYRSAPAIVSAADAVISVARDPGVPPLAAVRSLGARVRVFACDDPAGEARFIASEISDLVGGIDSVSVDKARAHTSGEYAFSEIAVLARTRAVRDAILPGLQAAGLPLSLGAHSPLSEEEPFRSIVAALRLACNNADVVSSRVLSARPGLVEQVLARGPELSHAASTDGVCAALDLLAGPIVPVDRSLQEISLGEEAIRAAAERHGKDVASFLAHVSLCTLESEGPRVLQRISLLTFHAAKGLEFSAVFIAGAEEGITPLEAGRGIDLAEERRLFYVAMTRARDTLCISHCRRRAVHGLVTERQPSRFLDDIPASSRISEGHRSRRDSQLPLF
jgi:superfamily I DNA/RNA helicase